MSAYRNPGFTVVKNYMHFHLEFQESPTYDLDTLQVATDCFTCTRSYVAGCPMSLQLFMRMLDDLCGMTDDELEIVVE